MNYLRKDNKHHNNIDELTILYESLWIPFIFFYDFLHVHVIYLISDALYTQSQFVQHINTKQREYGTNKNVKTYDTTSALMIYYCNNHAYRIKQLIYNIQHHIVCSRYTPYTITNCKHKNKTKRVKRNKQK